LLILQRSNYNSFNSDSVIPTTSRFCSGYLYTCSKNDVISSSENIIVLVGWGLWKYVFGQTYFRASAVDSGLAYLLWKRPGAVT